MAEVNIYIHGKPYAIACDDGQEARVQDLGRFVDARLRQIGASGGAQTDSHLLVLTALIMADELNELRETANQLTRQVGELRDAAPQAEPVSGLSGEEEGEILAAIDHLSNRIDSVADRLAKI